MCVTDLFFIDLGLSHQAQEVLGSSPDSASNLVSANMHLRGYQLVALVLTSFRLCARSILNYAILASA